MEKKMLKRSLAVWMVLILLFISVAPVAMMEGEEASTPEAQETVSVDNNINEEADELLDENAEMLDNVTSVPATVEEPAAEEPAVEEPAVEEPAAEEAPAVEEPAVEEPAVEEPAAEEATAVEEPAAEEPAAEEPVAVEEPAVEEPAAEEPVVEEPVAEEPAVKKPAVEEPVAEEPVAEEPAVEEPAVEEPAAEEPAAEEAPVVEEPVAEEAPAVEEPAVEEPAAEEPAAEEAPTVEEPAVEEPAVEEPVAEEPVAEEPAVEEPEVLDTRYLDVATDIRLAPDGLSEIIVTAPAGIELNVYDYSGHWALVHYNHAELGLVVGYVYCQPEDTSSMSVTIFSSRRAVMTPGETVYLTSVLTGFENHEVSYQWQCDMGNGFVDVEGATSATWSFSASVETLSYDWRLAIYYR